MPQRVAFTAAVGRRLRPAIMALVATIAALAFSMGANTDRALAGGVDLIACASDGAENLFDFADWSGGSVYVGHACPANYSTQGVWALRPRPRSRRAPPRRSASASSRRDCDRKRAGRH
jgi:hypothetical protein